MSLPCLWVLPCTALYGCTVAALIGHTDHWTGLPSPVIGTIVITAVILLLPLLSSAEYKARKQWLSLGQFRLGDGCSSSVIISLSTDIIFRFPWIWSILVTANDWRGTKSIGLWWQNMCEAKTVHLPYKFSLPFFFFLTTFITPHNRRLTHTHSYHAQLAAIDTCHLRFLLFLLRSRLALPWSWKKWQSAAVAAIAVHSWTPTHTPTEADL